MTSPSSQLPHEEGADDAAERGDEEHHRRRHRRSRRHRKLSPWEATQEWVKRYWRVALFAILGVLLLLYLIPRLVAGMNTQVFNPEGSAPTLLV